MHVSNSYSAVQNTAAVNPADVTSQAQAQQDIADLNTAITNAENNLYQIQLAANQAALEGVDLSSEVENAQALLARAQADLGTATAFLNEGIQEGNPQLFDAVASLTSPDITALNGLGSVATQAQATANNNEYNTNDLSQQNLNKAQAGSSAAAAQSAKDLAELQALVQANPGDSYIAGLLTNATNANNYVVQDNANAHNSGLYGTQTMIENANYALQQAAYVRTALQEAITDVYA